MASVFKKDKDGGTTVVLYESSMSPVPAIPYGSEMAFIMVRRNISKRRRRGSWQWKDETMKVELFYTCPFCNAINTNLVGGLFEYYDYKPGAFGAESVWCIKCERHLRLYYAEKLPDHCKRRKSNA